MAGAALDLLAILDAAGFVYNVRAARSGVPYAGFQWESAPFVRRGSYTALAEGDALRLTLHDPPVGSDDYADGLFRTVSVLPLARLYTNEEGLWELTLAILVGGAPFSVPAFSALLEHLGMSGEFLSNGGEPPMLPVLSDPVDRLPTAQILDQLELDPAPAGNGSRIELPLPRLGVRGQFRVDDSGSGWVRIAGQLMSREIALDQDGTEVFNRLQLWAPVGRFVLLPGAVAGRHLVGCEVVTPVLGREGEDVVADSLRAAVRLLGTAHQHLS